MNLSVCSLSGSAPRRFTGHVTSRRGKKRIPERCSSFLRSHPQIHIYSGPRRRAFPRPAHSIGFSYKNGEKPEHHLLQHLNNLCRIAFLCLYAFSVCNVFSSRLSLFSPPATPVTDVSMFTRVFPPGCCLLSCRGKLYQTCVH